MATATRNDLTYRLQRDVFERSDHGLTWVESFWFETPEGDRVSPIIPAAGYCDRLGHLPGGPVADAGRLADEEKYYCGAGGASRFVKSEFHHNGFWHIGPVCIVKIDD